MDAIDWGAEGRHDTIQPSRLSPETRLSFLLLKCGTRECCGRCLSSFLTEVTVRGSMQLVRMVTMYGSTARVV